jgi:hypothetical protein
MDEIFIQHRFTYTDPKYGTFSDAIVLPQTDYNALKQADIDTLKQTRIDNWINLQKNPPVQAIIPPVQQLADIDNQIESLATQRETIIATTQVVDPLDVSASPGLQIDNQGDPLSKGY